MQLVGYEVTDETPGFRRCVTAAHGLRTLQRGSYIAASSGLQKETP